ncbi:MAG: hypothetical protein ACPG4T_07585 [Nannocystaceae bacterium]
MQPVQADPVEVVANIEEAVRETEGKKISKLQALLDTKKTELERAQAERASVEAELEQQTKELGARLTRAEKVLRDSEDVDDRLSRAEYQLKELEDATWREFLILLAIGAVFTGVGFYLQRRYNWRVPWAAVVGSASAMYALSNKNLPKNVKYVMVGGGAGLALGGMSFTIINAFPGWHKSPS